MKLIIRHLGLADYADVWQKMKAFTHNRDEHTADELWLVQHPAVFTLGQQGERSHILQRTQIPIIQTDRGGHVTYHGPGQWVAYPLFDLKRRNLGARRFVTAIETLLIDLLKDYEIDAYARLDAPGVYVEEKKIASIGLRIRKGCSYHGLALNVDMDLTPFSYINPCGMANMSMTMISHFVPQIEMGEVNQKIVGLFEKM